METSKVFLRDMNTGEELEILPGTIETDWAKNDTHPIDICHSYHFECDIKSLQMNDTAKDLFLTNQVLKTANRLADELNDLIEEYHAPGTPRCERRAIKREFGKIFRIFRNHCQLHQIDFKFMRLEK